MLVKEYIDTAKSKLMPFLMEKQIEPTTYRCTIHLTKNNVTLMHINKTTDGIELLLTESMAFEDINDLHLVLNGMVERYTLQFTPTYLLLSPEDYQLFIIESMPVKSNEIREALNWRLRGLISYPVENALTDYFLLPPSKNNQTSSMVAIVSAETAKIQQLINTVKNSGFLLTTIDIPEMAMRNLTRLYENDDKSTAFIYFYERYAILNITHQGMIHFSRRIDIPTGLNHDDQSFSLELLRYFDYFQAQWRYPAPTRIFAASFKQNTQDMIELLSKQLMTPIEKFQIPGVEIEEKWLLTYAEALREEGQHAAPRN